MSTANNTTRKIRIWGDYEAALKVGGVSQAEQELVAACKEGRECVLGDGTRPEGPSDERNIGADLLRYLITGGCNRCDLHDWGVQLKGAYVSDVLDLSFATAQGITRMICCEFAEKIQALQSEFELLNLSGSSCMGLYAQGAKVTGSVFLRNGFHAKGTVNLKSIFIGGQLTCVAGQFKSTKKYAFDAQGAQIMGSVLLTNGFKANGAVSLKSAQIGGQLTFTGACIRASERIAVSLQKCRTSALIWRGLSEVSGGVSLDGAEVGDLVDDMESWALPDKLGLNGLTYKTIHGPTDEALRLSWLAKSQEGRKAFQPQPYEQLAYVLKRMGHTREARHVQFEKECKLAISQRDEIWSERKISTAKGWRGAATRQLADGWHWMRDIASSTKHTALSTIVGYGYLPARSLALALAMVTSSALFYSYVWAEGGMVPNTPVVLNSASWAAAMAERPDAPALVWADGEIGQHYETFFSPTYAADVFIPLIDFGQEAAWAPTTATKLGTFAWAMAWLLKGFGWIVTALGAAAITGIIRRE